ncbi:hypothetical protein Cgig2_004109 [Carnegiea gigantea]|uniref:Bifunctional inhibitor/plant lipid transfer protein/seed storage helical domain-containing protein n=1 Tax=Carnegiea gigantea TaxID=171969 RepID=A0A9Q1QP71_9CARY|nr:hypothetical protein Cgig2_004109 [Carnegiea gigantea]
MVTAATANGQSICDIPEEDLHACMSGVDPVIECSAMVKFLSQDQVKCLHDYYKDNYQPSMLRLHPGVVDHVLHDKRPFWECMKLCLEGALFSECLLIWQDLRAQETSSLRRSNFRPREMAGGKAVVVVFVAVMVAATTANGLSVCNIPAEDLHSCESAVATANPMNPTDQCCAVVKGLNADQVKCLCDYKTTEPSVLWLAGVDPARAMKLPGLCSGSSDQFNCS